MVLLNETIESARSSLHYNHVDESFWVEAIVTAAYMHNRLPNAARGDHTRYEVVWGKKSRLDHMWVFGSAGFVYVDKSKRVNFDSKTHRCIFLGYTEGCKAYLTRKIALDERPLSDYGPASYTREYQLQWTVLDDRDDPSPTTPRPTNDEMDVDAAASQDGNPPDTTEPTEVTMSPQYL
ncbi:hypothetical protein PsorP6_016601 [Peronosclerospora sorghi]|uniref:Uncharacterized protein n=1 Tax=Peronosclerospora sorghi TaxID=230839 RepID=A0ACC0VL31_9STRA|nr:hypothetical protein PsorP6_016601 [Peronosclerospora sorghi]